MGTGPKDPVSSHLTPILKGKVGNHITSHHRAVIGKNDLEILIDRKKLEFPSRSIVDLHRLSRQQRMCNHVLSLLLLCDGILSITHHHSTDVCGYECRHENYNLTDGSHVIPSGSVVKIVA